MKILNLALNVPLARGYSEKTEVPALFDQEWYLRYFDHDRREKGTFEHYMSGGWEKGYSPHPLFDVSWYLERYPDVKRARVEPLNHYLVYGWREGRWPNPLFDPAQYLLRNPDVASSDGEPLTHYSKFGWREGRQPHSFFDLKYYKSQLVDEEQSDELLGHYLHKGRHQGLRPLALFCEDFYIRQVGAVAVGDMDPLAHYIHFGAPFGRSPNPLFDPNYYWKKNADVDCSGYLGFLHYIERGEREGRKPNPFFFPGWYGAVYETNGCSPLIHYIEQGCSRGFNPCPYFWGRWYANKYTDCAADPLEHFLHVGSRQSRDPNPIFDSVWYQKTYMVGLEDCSSLEHFIEVGQRLDYKPSTTFNTSFYRRRYQAHLSDTYCEPLEHYLTLGREAGLCASEYEAVLRKCVPFYHSDASEDNSSRFNDSIEQIVGCLLGQRPFVVFISDIDPVSASSQDGYVQRIRSIDAAISDWTRVYLRGRRASEEDIISNVAPNVFVIRLSDDGRDKRLGLQVCKKAHAIYSHSILPLGDSACLELFLAGRSRVIDLHGAVPEESYMQGQLGESGRLHDLERKVIGAATDIVCVSNRMKQWIQSKYPTVAESAMVVIPVVPVNVEVCATVSERANPELRAVYAGGLQKWQCAEKMLASIEELWLPTILLTHDESATCAYVDRYGGKLPISIKSASSPDELWGIYAESDFGFAIRSRSIVNQVACPTKIVEYCSAGVVPILDFDDIGDFKEMGLQFVRLEELTAGLVPTSQRRFEMMSRNLDVFFELTKRYEKGLHELVDRVIQRLTTIESPVNS